MILIGNVVHLKEDRNNRFITPTPVGTYPLKSLKSILTHISIIVLVLDRPKLPPLENLGGVRVVLVHPLGEPRHLHSPLLLESREYHPQWRLVVEVQDHTGQ